MTTPALFSPLKIRSIEFKNRIFVSPMCQYSAVDGVPGDWHFVHLGSRAVGGAALVVAEATGITPEGRITAGDTGIWNETQTKAWSRITHFIREQGAIPGIQIAHAGRKASTQAPWLGGKPLTSENGAWQTLGPSPVEFGHYPAPREMTVAEIENHVKLFGDAADRARQAGFDVVEVHMAHGYLLHEFLSPLSNQRKDSYGGTLENRMRFPLAVAQEVRQRWPENLPVFVRISASDWTDGGWDLEQSVVLCRELKKIGVDLIDTSSGGNVAKAHIPAVPGYQVHFAEGVRRRTGMLTAAVGLITDPRQAETLLKEGKADAVFIARELLRDPYWPLHAAKTLGYDMAWPNQYERAKP